MKVESRVFWTWVFFNKLFEMEKLLFWNCELKYFETLFLGKNGIILIFFCKKKLEWPKKLWFLNIYKLTLIWPFVTFKDFWDHLSILRYLQLDCKHILRKFCINNFRTLAAITKSPFPLLIKIAPFLYWKNLRNMLHLK